MKHQSKQLSKGHRMGKAYDTHEVDYQFDSKINGYTTHTFSHDYSSLRTDFISADRDRDQTNHDSIVYSFSIEKGQFKNKNN